MKFWGICSAAVALALVSTPAFAGVAEGNAAWLAGKYDEAIAQWRPAADAGSPEAQFNLGQAYKLGRGVQLNMKEAETWYRKSAVQGFTDAQDMLGLMLFRQGDRQEAMPWIEKSAARGEPRAMYVLGTAKFNGDYTGKDWPGAYALMTRASATGLDQAKTSLTQMDRFLSAADKAAGRQLAERQTAAQPQQAAGQSAGLDTRTAQAMPPASQPAYVPINPNAAAPVQTAQAVPAQPNYPDSSPVYAAPPTAQVNGQTVVVPGAEVNVPMPAPAYTPPPAPTYSAPVQTAPQPAAPPPVRAPRPPRPVAVAGGPWKIQLGAFATPGAPEEAWRKLTSRIGVLRSLRFNTQAAGRVIRLQPVGLASRAEATRICRIVIATGNGCIPVAP